MKYNLRGTQKPIPEKLNLYLTDLQRLGLCQAENYGWHLEFVRRSTLYDTEAVIMDHLDNSVGLLQKDGTINTQVNLSLRH